MVFSSLVFLCIFFPVIFCLHSIVPSIRVRNILLILASLFFYAFGEPVYVILMVISAFLNYLCAALMGKTNRKAVLIAAVVINIGILCAFKYTGFFIITINSVLHLNITVPQITLPIGISFFTFQALSYVIDVYRGQVEIQRKFSKVLLYISFFPQLIAGPIVQYQEVSHALRDLKTTLYDVEHGLEVFCFGLGAKVLLANKISIFWNQVQGIGYANISTPVAWMGAVAYSFQIYFDFWGYSLMAIGLGYMMGFRLPKNFNSPYMVKSVTQFWRNWHMTLGRFFREYVYIPLGGNRRGNVRMLFHMFLVWSLTGLWHGASWNFVLWGLGFFVLLTLEKCIYGKFLENGKIIGHIYIWILIPVTWVIFAISDFPQLVIYLQQMVGIHNQPVLVGREQLIRYAKEYGNLFLLCAVFSTRLPERIYHYIRGGLVVVILAFGIFWLSVYELANGANNPFLYFRF